MPTSAASGTVTPVIGTPSVLATISTAGVYVLVVDTAAMVNGDVLTLTVQTAALAAGVQRPAYRATYAHAQSSPIKISTPVPVDVAIEFDLLQSAGVARAYPWKILAL